MVLTVVVAGVFGEGNISVGRNNSSIMMNAGPTSVFIVDTIGKLQCGGAGESWIDRQPPLTMWVRANGVSDSGDGEIFAGTAIPHKLDSSASRCAWRYDFEISTAGLYSIHVKVLTFNGFADSLAKTCATETIPPRNEQFDKQKHNNSEADMRKMEQMNYDVVMELAEKGQYMHHRGVSGFKMYGPDDACCEACKRSRNCKMFSVPGALHFDECELYFTRRADDVDFLDRDDRTLYLGRENSYSYTKQNALDFPSIRRRLAISKGMRKDMIAAFVVESRPTPSWRLIHIFDVQKMRLRKGRLGLLR